MWDSETETQKNTPKKRSKKEKQKKAFQEKSAPGEEPPQNPAKKEKQKPLTPKEFFSSKYGLLLLKEAQIEFQTKNAFITEKGLTDKDHFKYMQNVACMYLDWVRCSALCGNKRNQAYAVLKTLIAESLSEGIQDQPPAEQHPPGL
ncbi:hypothetical protein NECID01_0647 [Nematocida sp. AWRm77]|nr:hypothetical protein NECID01_0647 [Nematocida sp. AWRm77]